MVCCWDSPINPTKPLWWGGGEGTTGREGSPMVLATWWASWAGCSGSSSQDELLTPLVSWDKLQKWGRVHSPRAWKKPDRIWWKRGHGPIGNMLYSLPLSLYIWFSKVSVSEGLWAEDLRLFAKKQVLLSFWAQWLQDLEKGSRCILWRRNVQKDLSWCLG